MDRSQVWATRCVHEASLWPSNAFVTLTYRPEELVFGRSGVPTLVPRDFQLFMKRLREARREDWLATGRKGAAPKIRFLVAGEYGKLGRPHYHALLFNADFADKVFFQRRAGGVLYRSAELESLWPMGFSSVAEVTAASAAYVARYTLKKFGMPSVEGEVEVGAARGKLRVPEFLRMSRRPGIGAGWIDKYQGDVYPWDEVVRDGQVMRPPRYYDDRFAAAEPEVFAKVREKRLEAMESEFPAELTKGRLTAKRELAIRRVRDFLKREI